MKLSRTLAAAAVLLIAAGVRPAAACAFPDTHITLHGDHPETIPVAVAAAQEIAAGRLVPTPAADPVDRLALELAVPVKVKDFGRRIAAALPADRIAALPEFFMLLVQTRMWARLRPEPGGFSESCDPVAPELIHAAEERGAILITSEPVLRDLALGALGYAEAERRGLVVADGEAAAVGRLRAALAEALR
jgi:hypothetical protein